MKYIKFFLVLGIIARLAYAADANHYSATTEFRYSDAGVHLGDLNDAINLELEDDELGRKKIDFTNKEKLKVVCEEMAGMLFFGNPLTNVKTKNFVGLDGITKADEGYGFRESDGSLKDEYMMIQEVTFAGFIGQHYSELFTKNDANAQDIIEYFKLDRVIDNSEREHVAHVLRLMQIAAGKSVSWNGTNFGDELVGEDVVGFYERHAKLGRLKYLAVTKFIPGTKNYDLKRMLNFNRTRKECIKGQAFGLMYALAKGNSLVSQETEDYNKSLNEELQAMFPEEAAVLASPEKLKVIELFEVEHGKLGKKYNDMFQNHPFIKLLPLLYQDYDYLAANYKSEDHVEKIGKEYLKNLRDIEKGYRTDKNKYPINCTFLPISLFSMLAMKELTIRSLKTNENKALEKLVEFRRLSKLVIENTEIDSLPDNIGDLENLESLTVTGRRTVPSKMKVLPDSIGNLTNLTELSFSDIPLKELPETIGGMSSLETLRVRFGQLKTFPKTIGKLSNLKFITADHNEIESLPDEIGNLAQLVSLILDDNNLSSIPETLSNLNLLTQLRIDTNYLTEIPQSVLNMHNLNDLDQQLKVQKKQ